MAILTYLSAFLLFLVGLFTTAQGTWIDDFFRWLHLGFIINFIVQWNYVIITVICLYFIYKLFKCRIWWVYLIIALALYYFLKSINFLGKAMM